MVEETYKCMEEGGTKVEEVETCTYKGEEVKVTEVVGTCRCMVGEVMVMEVEVGRVMVEVVTCRCMVVEVKVMEVVGKVMVEVGTYRCMVVVEMVMVVVGTCRHREGVVKENVEEETYKCTEEGGKEMGEVEICKHKVEMVMGVVGTCRHMVEVVMEIVEETYKCTEEGGREGDGGGGDL
ncbi:hypothetical protein NC652_002732 [Populus alba x Populus x berolinensis]|nr:hypothetical protein NC652_002732 [Populus alba x Populus x berolinensis]